MEVEFIRWLRQQLPDHPQLVLGLGDDAAILHIQDPANLVVTSDLLTDDVDFLLNECGPLRVGRKSLAVNLSDLAAMAAKPRAVVVSLALPNQHAMSLAQGVIAGMLPLAKQFDVAIAGGDTNSWGQGLVVSVTALGETTPRGPWRRAGARPGDRILVTGSFGGSILGKHFDFEPRVAEALWLNQRFVIHAAIDVSDGLSLDLARLAEASRCGAAMELDQIPIAAAAHQLAQQARDSQTALDHALGDGEDFELILAVPAETADQIVRDQPLSVPITEIGEFISRGGLWQRAADGGLQPMEPRGFKHG